MAVTPSNTRSARIAALTVEGLTSRWFHLSLAMAAGLAVGMLTLQSPLLGVLLVLALGGAVLLVQIPSAPAFLFTLLLWSNAPVIASNFHDVPFFIAASYPGLLLIPIARVALLERRGLVIPTSLLLFYAYFLIQFLGAATAHRPVEAKEVLMTTFNEGVVLATLTVNAIRDVRLLRAATWGLVVASLSMGGIPLIQQLTGAFETDLGGFGQYNDVAFRTGVRSETAGELSQFRLTGPIGESNRFAQVLMTGFPLCLVLFRRSRSLAPKALALACMLCCLAGFTLAFSRGAAVAAVLLFAVMVAVKAVNRRELGFLVLATVAVVALSPGYRTRLATIPKALTIFSSDVSDRQADGAVAGRVTEMLGAARVYADHPILGVGPGMFKFLAMEYGNDLGFRRLETERHAHSLYLEVAAEHGTVGLALFALLLYAVLTDLNRVRVRTAEENPELSNLALGYFLALSSYLTSGIFLHLSYARYFWIVIALAICVPVIARAEVRSSSSTRLAAQE